MTFDRGARGARAAAEREAIAMRRGAQRTDDDRSGTMTTTIRRALRMLARTPTFTIVAVLTLALAIGSLATIFSVVNAVLLKPLPYPGAERIIRIVRVQGTCSDCPIARPAFFEWRDQSSEAFEALGAFSGTEATLTGDGEAEQLNASSVTAEFWAIMGVAPLLGRTFTAEEDDEARDVVVISHAFWQRRFAGARDVIGRRIVLNKVATEIVGVMPAEFSYPSNDAWLPAQLATATRGRDTNYLHIVARLREGVELERASALMNSIAARQAVAFPEEHRDLQARLVPLQTRVTSTVKPALDVLLAASGIVVLIACANLANLMLARGQARRRELAMRAALGANGRRLVAHLLGESVLIATIGAALGLGIARLSIAAIPALAPDLLPAYNPLVVDAAVVAFVAGVAVLSLLGFGLLPAWRHAQADPGLALQDEARGGTSGRARSRGRALLVVGEVALSFVLLAGAALMIESLRRLGNVDPSVDVEQVVTADVSLPPTPNRPGESSDEWAARHAAETEPRIEALLARLAALPEVESVAMTDAVPLSGRGNTNSPVAVVGREYPGGEAKMPLTEWRFVSSDYFGTMGLSIVRGRIFGDEQGRGSPQTTEVLVNDAFVRAFLSDVDPLGREVKVMDDTPKTIVGVVESARQWGLAREPSPEVYLPIRDIFYSEVAVVARTRVDPSQAAEPLRRAIRETLPDAPVTRVRTMAQVVEDGAVMRRFFATLIIAFSAIALLLAMVGLYGVLAYSVAQRRAEIGVRMSLGADARDVLRLVLRQGLVLVAVGVAAGVVGALALARALASLLFGVAAHDPVVLLVVAVSLVATAALACAVPAWRAARIAPTEALRHA